jgi:2-amino-4-hydroxy-6-hydroxymethyldihydropteridine diphosphokinase
MVSVYLLLGSNLGDKQMFLRQAAVYIEEQIGAIVQQSSIYVTQSWGKTDAPDYLNQVLLVETQMQPDEVLTTVLNIELLLGRERKEIWGSRTMDIDILFYDEAVISKRNLTIPHPHLHSRRFTLEPLAEIAPELLHPVLRKTVNELKSQLKDNLQVKKYIFE